MEDLVRRLVELKPTIYYEPVGYEYCFFCEAIEKLVDPVKDVWKVEHAEDCLWWAAKKQFTSLTES